MNTFVLTFVSLMSASQHTTGHEIRVHSLAQQTDERAGRDCAGSSKVIVYERASDMGRGK